LKIFLKNLLRSFSTRFLTAERLELTPNNIQAPGYLSQLCQILPMLPVKNRGIFYQNRAGFSKNHSGFNPDEIYRSLLNRDFSTPGKGNRGPVRARIRAIPKRPPGPFSRPFFPDSPQPVFENILPCIVAKCGHFRVVKRCQIANQEPK
jgi:hypothetical protein